jgi:ubiquitin-small subunit ribosomal protein S27Ae
MAIKVKIKGKKKPRNKPTSKKYKMYKIEGDKVIKQRSCPRCGPGIFLSTGQGRFYCGKCHFTEFAKKEKPVEAEVVEAVKE